MPARVWASFRRTMMAIAVAIASASPGNQAQAGTVLLGNSGWQAVWDNSLDPYVSITNIVVEENTIFLTKNAEFIQGPGRDGLFPTIPIVFQQIAVSSINSIVIEDENILNNTGADWSDFHFQITGISATFNPGLSSGFDVLPFTSSIFSADNKRLDLDDGTVANGTAWTPGAGDEGGRLWIDVISGGVGQFRFFTLKETPTPGPTALMVMATGLLFIPIRRRLR